MKHFFPCLLVAAVLLLPRPVLAQLRTAQSFFTEDAAVRTAASAGPEAAALTHYRALTVDVPALRAALATAPPEGRAAAPLVLALPLPDGGSARYALRRTDVLNPADAARFPNINTYAGVGLDDPTATVRVDLTPQGFHAQVLTASGNTYYLDPARPGDRAHALSYWRRDMNRAAGSAWRCGFDPSAADQAAASARQQLGGTAQRSSGGTLRTFRLAVAATGEYTAFQGGTVALAQAAIVTSVNRVNGVYERELAVRMVLVANNTNIIYTNPATDPYTNNDGSTMLGQNQTNVTAIIGNGNYDIGHVFSTGGGGVASLGSVCSNGRKAQGVTGSPAPVGDAFDIDYVAHEMGHQFGGNHTFNNNTGGSCAGNRNAATAYEPGSGSTIMAYAGICGDDVQNNSDPYFHTGSYDEIMTFLGTISCGTSASTGLSTPALTLPAGGLTLPKGTPFRLTASATNPNGRALTYAWEQYDLGSAATRSTAQVANDDVPLFRSVLPNASPTRYFPNLTDLTANTTSNTSGNERLPTVARPLIFRCTVRDSYETANGPIGAVTNTGTVALTVNGTAGPFLLTAPNTATTWAGGSSQTVTWDVAGTTANGVNCASVNVLLSTDGGLTYPTTLLAGTANDGNASIAVPNTATTTARIMVEAVGNYFFDISNANFTVTATGACATPTGVSVSGVTETTASVSWTASGSPTGYTVTTSPATTSQMVSGTSASLTGLVGGTNYTVQVVSNCLGGGTSLGATATFTTQGCTAPTGVTVSSISGSGATVSFTASAVATGYTISTTPATTTQNISGTTAILTGLSPSTSYVVNVLSTCAAGSPLAPATANFTTGVAGPVNDDCANATGLVSSTVCNITTGTLAAATQSLAPITCQGFASSQARDVWYSFVANNPTHTITVSTAPGGTDFDGVLEVLSGSCTGPANVGCRDFLSFGGETLTLNTLTAGTTYLVRYYEFTSSGTAAAPATSGFRICVTNPALPCNPPTTLTMSAIAQTTATVSYTASASATSYTVTTTPATSSQTISGTSASLTGLAAGTAYTVNVVSNCAGGATSAAATASFTTLAPAPVVTSVTAPVNATYRTGQNLNFTVDFDQSMTVNIGGGTPALALTVGSTARSASYLSGSGTAALVFRYTVPAGDLDLDGVALGTLALNGGTIRNAGSTNATLTLNGVGSTSAVLVDGVAPTVSSSNRQTPTAALTNAAGVTFRVVFSEAVTGVNTADFALVAGGTASGTVAAVAAVSGSGNTAFDVSVNTLSGDGTLRLDVNASGTGIFDGPGNALGGGFGSGQTYLLDRSGPQTTIDSQPAASTSATSAAFTFSGTDANGVASFEARLDGAAFASASSPTNYSGLTLGNHTFQVRAIDNAGNLDATPASYIWTVVAAPCDAPTNVLVSAIGSTTATVSFVPSATASSYTVLVSPGFAPQTVAVSPLSLTGLAPNTSYTVAVASNCAGGATSAALSIGFTTDLADLVVSSFQVLTGGSYRNITITGPTTGGAGQLQLTGPLSVTGAFVVQDGGVLRACGPITGSGSFALAAGGTFSLCSPQGISASGATGEVQVAGTRSFSDDASYQYTGKGQVTGPALPATVRNLTNTSSTALDLSQPLAIRRQLALNSGNLRLGAHNLTLLSTASFTAMVVNASIGVVLNNGAGVAIVQRYISPSTGYTGAGYRHYSSPVSATTVADLAVSGLFAPQVSAAFNALPTPALSAAQFPNVFGYDETRLTASFAGFDTGWRSPASLTDALTPTRGYTVNVAPAATVDLRGQLNNGTLNTGPLGRVALADGGWHLLGNPYPAPLSWGEVTNTPSNIPAGLNAAIYVSEPSSQYGGFYRAFINGFGTLGFDGNLAAMQGFFIRATQPVPGGFSFQNSYRASSYNDPAFHRAAASPPALRLALSGPTGTDETVVYLDPAATPATDARLDAAKLPNPGLAPSLATQLPGAEALAISALPLMGPADPARRLPLVLTAPAGTYRLTADLGAFAPGQAVQLLDYLLGTTTDLRQQPVYAFGLGAAPVPGRFVLLLGPAAGPLAKGVAAEAISFLLWPNPAPAGAALRVVLPAALPAATATLRDVLGRTVAYAPFAGTGASLPTAGLATGTYLLTVQASGKAPATQRVVLE